MPLPSSYSHLFLYSHFFNHSALAPSCQRMQLRDRFSGTHCANVPLSQITGLLSLLFHRFAPQLSYISQKSLVPSIGLSRMETLLSSPSVVLSITIRTRNYTAQNKSNVCVVLRVCLGEGSQTRNLFLSSAARELPLRTCLTYNSQT